MVKKYVNIQDKWCTLETGTKSLYDTLFSVLDHHCTDQSRVDYDIEDTIYFENLKELNRLTTEDYESLGCSGFNFRDVTAFIMLEGESYYTITITVKYYSSDDEYVVLDYKINKIRSKHKFYYPKKMLEGTNLEIR